MSTSAPDRPARPAAPRRPKAAGQWGAGHREPLNASEQMKKDDDGLNVEARIHGYARTGFRSIDPADLRGRMRWFGLYTQRAPGIPGGRTALLAPEDLEDEYFMLRVRIDGGRLTAAQARALGEVAAEHGRDYLDVTDRQNVQLHWIRIEDVPRIWERLEAVGLGTTEACGDTPRTLLGCPLAGVAADEVLDATPQVEQIAQRYVGDPAFSNLPRKYKSAVSGCAVHCTLHEVNDVGLVGVVHPELGPGYDLWVGGGLSTNPHAARRIGVFVAPDRAEAVWAAVTTVFRDWGYRRLRTRARLKFLVADWGAEKFRQVLEETLGEALPDGPAAALPEGTTHRDHVGLITQHDGRVAVGAVLRSGRSSGTELQAVADLMESVGSDRVRTTPQQGLVVLDVPAERAQEVADALDAVGMHTRPDGVRRGVMACTGIEFCKLALVETKARAETLVDELHRRVGDLDEPFRLHVNGCPNACARFQIADVGLKGSLVPGPDGEPVEGFQVHLGGRLDGEATTFGRKSRGLKVTADEAPDWLERVVRRWQADRAAFEPFAVWAQRVDEEALR